MITVQCWVCKSDFDIYPSRYKLCRHKRFFCTRDCKDSTQVKTAEERKETKTICNRRARDYRYAARRKWIDSIKLERGCKDCGYKEYAAALHFDHRDPKEKKFNLAQGWTIGRQRVLDEIAKCDIRCANCHAVKTADDRNKGLIATNKQTRERSFIASEV